MKIFTFIRTGSLLLAAVAAFSVKAAEISVETILATVEQPDALTANFTVEKRTPAVAVPLKSEGRLVVPLKSEGRLVLSKEKGLLWLTSSPFEDALGFSKTKSGRLDDNGLWVVEESQAAGRALEMTQKFIAAGPQTLSDHFFLSPSGTPSHWQLIASPKGGTPAQFLTEILFVGDQHLKRVQIVQTDGTITRIEFSQINSSPVLSGDDARRLESLQ